MLGGGALSANKRDHVGGVQARTRTNSGSNKLAARNNTHTVAKVVHVVLSN